jgi:hypothetical protein
VHSACIDDTETAALSSSRAGGGGLGLGHHEASRSESSEGSRNITLSVEPAWLVSAERAYRHAMVDEHPPVYRSTVVLQSPQDVTWRKLIR